VELDGQPLHSPAVTRAYLPQHAQLADSYTVEDALEAQFQGSTAWLQLEFERMGLPLRMPAGSERVATLARSRRRLLAVLASLQPTAALYLVDEPTADLEDGEIELVRRRLAELARSVCVVVATHNRQDCLALGGRTALIAGSGVQECAQTTQFFADPSTPAGRNYVDNGNCSLPGPARPQSADGSWWAVPGLLCGMSRPGLIYPIDQQLQGLQAQGVRHLVCLEEHCAYPVAQIRELGISHYHYAVPDMAPPTFGQAVDMCRLLEPAIRANEGIAMHCRGGLGRTGTGLGALLIWFGDSADDAIAKVRRAQPLAIQTLVQVRFLYDFASRIRGWHPPVKPTKENVDVAR
jgi:atypical dual specificity phosphatase